MNPNRRPLIAGNWKMNAGGADGCELAAGVAHAAAEFGEVDVLVSPPFTALAAVSHELREAGSDVLVAAQNMHYEDSGAFTGEISAGMLKVAGAGWVILGHSERRHVFGEDDELIGKKMAAAFAAGLTPILCVGETLEQRDAGETLKVVQAQVDASLGELAANAGVGVIAYEPVWAIGTGKVASPEDAQEVHAAIRAQLGQSSDELAHGTRILYGGSVKPNNVEGLLAKPDLDGALVGGASLKADSFGKLIEIASKLAKQDQTE
ncbi:MAG: triose-phosphate isomerase [Polyangiaceae bacterium]